MEEIEKGDLVLTHKGRYRRVIGTMSRQYDGEISRIFLARNGARGLPLTIEHPVLISNSKGETEWIKPCDIKFGRNKVPPSGGDKWQKLSDGVFRICSVCRERKKTEEFYKGKSGIDGKRGVCIRCCKRTFRSYVVIPKNKGEGSGVINVRDYLSFPIFQRWKTGFCSYTKGGFYFWPKITPIIHLTENLAYFLGLYFAEGTAQENGAGSLTFNIKETCFADFCVSFMEEAFGVKVSTQKRPEKGILGLSFCNRPLALILRGMVGIGAHNKKVPREILESSSPEVRKAFLRGALDGDGKKGLKDPGYIKLSSQKGIWGLKTLIADQGVYSEVKKIPSTLNGKKFVGWSVQFQAKAKFRRSLDFPEFVAVPIREVVTEKYSGPVYNFSVEEDESYVSDFVLHNCEAYFRDDNCPILQKLGIPKTLTIPRGNDKETWLARHPNGSYVDYAKYFHLTLNFLDYEAWQCAVKLLSKADDTAEQYGSERKPIFTWDDIEELAGHNVMAGSSCLIGMIGRHLVREESSRETKIKAATQYFERLQSLFKERFYAELFPHVCDRNYAECILVNVEGPKGKQTLKFYYGKKLKTNQNEADGITAQELAAKYDSKKYKELIAVKNYRVWEEYPEKLKLLSVEKKEGFIQNECTVWAPNGDVQWGANKFTLGMAKKHGLMIIPSDDSHFATCQDKIVQDVRLAQAGAWRFSGCFADRTPVDMADGRKIPISQIQVGDYVKSFDFLKNEVVAARVLSVIPTPASPSDFIANEFKEYGGKGQRRSIVSTPNHNFWTSKGWMPISQIRRKIGIKREKPNSALLEVLTGTLLGDANISLAGREATPYFAYGHCLKQKVLTENVASYLGTKCHVSERRKSYKGPLCKETSTWTQTNSLHPIFVSQRKSWYPSGKKIVPKGLVLTPRVLAWWYMDDGSRCIGPRQRSDTEQYRLYTMGFTRKDVEFLVKKLKEIGCGGAHVYDYRGPFIAFPKIAFRNFQRLVAPYIPPELQYKLEPQFRGLYKKDLAPGFDGETVYVVATKHPRSLPTSAPHLNTKIKYDLEIENHSCFFVDGILVHNSYHRQSSDEAYAYFKQYHNISESEFEGWVDNSLNFAERFKGFEFKTEPSLPVKFYPKDTLKHAKELIQKYGRFINKPEYVSRLKTELDILHRNGKIDLLPYFFLAEEQCRLHANQGLLTGPGRGSAAGLLFSYLLGITHIDPLQYGLSLERFITMDRINAMKLPDVDLDFPDRKLLVGSEGEPINVIEFEAEDGTKHTIPETMKLETDQGLLTVREAVEKGADLKPWWVEKGLNENFV